MQTRTKSRVESQSALQHSAAVENSSPMVGHCKSAWQSTENVADDAECLVDLCTTRKNTTATCHHDPESIGRETIGGGPGAVAVAKVHACVCDCGGGALFAATTCQIQCTEDVVRLERPRVWGGASTEWCAFTGSIAVCFVELLEKMDDVCLEASHLE